MDLNGKTVAVTGATGFLGQYIVDRLLKHNANVIAVVRNPDKVPALKKLDIEIRKADLADVDALSKAFKDTDSVISNAAVIGAKDFEQMVKANVDGTRNIFDAMRNAEVERCIQVSSAGVYKLAGMNEVITEDSPLRSASDKVHPFSAYPISKAISETTAWDMAKDYNIQLSTVRPFGIFGAFDNGTFFKWFKRIMLPPVTVYPTNLEIGLIYAGDIADGMCLMLANDISIGEAYNFSSIGLSPWEFANIWKQAGGSSPLIKIPVPVPLKQLVSTEKAQQQLKWQPIATIDACREILTAEQRGAHW